MRSLTGRVTRPSPSSGQPRSAPSSKKAGRRKAVLAIVHERWAGQRSALSRRPDPSRRGRAPTADRGSVSDQDGVSRGLLRRPEQRVPAQDEFVEAQVDRDRRAGGVPRAPCLLAPGAGGRGPAPVPVSCRRRGCLVHRLRLLVLHFLDHRAPRASRAPAEPAPIGSERDCDGGNREPRARRVPVGLRSARCST